MQFPFRRLTVLRRIDDHPARRQQSGRDREADQPTLRFRIENPYRPVGGKPPVRQVESGPALFYTRIFPQNFLHRLQPLLLKQKMVNVDFPIHIRQKEHYRPCQDDRQRDQTGQPRTGRLFPPKSLDGETDGKDETDQKQGGERDQQ